MKPEIFWRSYENAEQFVDVVKKYNPGFSFNSIQASRLQITQ